jgi:hypothetical protein
MRYVKFIRYYNCSRLNYCHTQYLQLSLNISICTLTLFINFFVYFFYWVYNFKSLLGINSEGVSRPQIPYLVIASQNVATNTITF